MVELLDTTDLDNIEYVIEITSSGHQEVFHELCHPDWLGRVRLEGKDDLQAEFRRYAGIITTML